LTFIGQMESRMDYNPPSVCRSRHARFHVFIICFSIVTTCPVTKETGWNPCLLQAGRLVNNYTSV